MQFALWIKEIIDRNKEQADTNDLLTTPVCNNDGYILIQGLWHCLNDGTTNDTFAVRRDEQWLIVAYNAHAWE